jgi:hypothetical protein
MKMHTCGECATTMHWLQRTQRERTECKCHRGTDPQAKTQCHELFQPFAPSHHWSLRNTSGYYLSEYPPQCGTQCHRQQQPIAATYCGHAQNRHHRQCHHHQYKRDCSADNSRQHPAHNHPYEPQTYCDNYSHQSTNATYLTASRKNAAGQ